MREAVFTELPGRQWAHGRLACVGLDPEMGRVARLAGYDWNEYGNCAVLVGGTYPHDQSCRPDRLEPNRRSGTGWSLTGLPKK